MRVGSKSDRLIPLPAWRYVFVVLFPLVGYLGGCHTPGGQPMSQVSTIGQATSVSGDGRLAMAPVADAGRADATAGSADAPSEASPLLSDGIPENATPASAPEARTALRLPWTGGETWYLTSGPHSTNRGALDFAPPNLNPRTKRRYPDGCSRQRGNAYWIRAAAPGRVASVLRRDCPVVQIEHDDGTATNYFHLQRKSVRALRLKVGDPVEAGQILGHPSCETGPKICGATHRPTGVHVHFYRTTVADAKRLPAHGMVISGWKVRAVGPIREGTMTKDDQVRSARGNAVGCACSPTVGLCGGRRNDLESDNASGKEPSTIASNRTFAPDRRRR